MTLPWSRRVLFLHALAFCLRGFTFDQAFSQGTRSDASRRNLRRQLSHLERQKFIRRFTVFARPPTEITGPLETWQPGEQEPDFDAIQYQAQKRIVQSPEAITVFTGTDRLANALGGCCGGKFNHHTASHDLNVAAVFFFLLGIDPNFALMWQGEDIIAPSRKGQKLPDAILFNGSGQPSLVIEFIGDYSVERIRAFHLDCQLRNLPYEVY